MAGRAQRGGMSEARRRRTRSRSHEVDEAAEAIVRHHSRVGRCVDVAFKRAHHLPKYGGMVCAGGLVVKLVKARSSERHASSAQVGDLVIEVAAMLVILLVASSRAL